MRRTCRHKIPFLLVPAILTVLLSGCAGKPAETMTLGDWIILLVQNADLPAGTSKESYYLNIPADSPYYSAVQSAAEWSVLDVSAPFDPDAVLTREWTAYTLMNLLERDINTEPSVSIRDISASSFPKHVSKAVAEGLLELDEHGRFQPKKAIDKSEAIRCLGLIVDKINGKYVDQPHMDLTFNDDAVFTEEVPQTFDEDSGLAVFDPESEPEQGQYVKAADTSGAESIYRINDIQRTDEGVYAEISPAHAEDIIDSINAADSFEIDFTDATIIDSIDGTIIQKGSAYDETAEHTFSHILGYEKTHEINGYRITYSVNATGIKADISKTTPKGLKVFGNLTVSSVKPTYLWKTENGTIKDGYFKVDFLSSENLGAECSSYKQMYGDFSRVDPKDFLGTIRNLYQEKKDAAEISIPLAKIEVPVPSSPILSIMMELQLTIKASGRAQLTLSQDNSIGMEIRDGKIREIKKTDMNAQAMLHGNTGLLGGVKLAMRLAGMALADIKVEAGVSANADVVVHLYDQNGSHTVMKANDIPSDLVDDLADGNENVLTCADIAAFKTIDIQLNSSNTLAGRAGLSKTIVLADEKNGDLIPGLNGHIENGQYVSHCTRKDRLTGNDSGSVVESDQIRIESYSLIADPGETKQIKIKALPRGYTVDDLVLLSDNSKVAEVSGTSVKAKSEGAAIIQIKTKDNKYVVNCQILVRHKA